MRLMLICTWEPHQRDEYAKQRLEKGRMTPEGIKVISEYVAVAGSKQIVVVEADDAVKCFEWGNLWNHLAKVEAFPVVEVKDDMMTQIE